MEFQRHPDNPVIPLDRSSSWRHDHTCDPVLYRKGDTWRLYIRGRRKVEDQYDTSLLIGSIFGGIFECDADPFDGVSWREYTGNPVIHPGPPGSFDDIGNFLGEIVSSPGGYLLFGHAVSHQWSIDVDKGIGRGGKSGTLLKSPDGIQWQRAIDQPLTPPFSSGHVAVFHEDQYHLFFNRRGEGETNPLVVIRSSDPYHFEEATLETALEPGPPGSWDSQVVQNPRVWRDGDVWYMHYAGSDRFLDTPHHFGLAASYDLKSWTRYPGNPIFSRGEEGAWDDNGIWPGSCAKVDGTYYLYYEGRNCGEPRDQADARATGRGYGGTSQVGLAIMKSDVFFFMP